jgi:dephospho-CoA kinase
MRVLLTGVSGTGKSTVSEALADRGYRSIDLDTSQWSHWVDYVPTADEAGTSVLPGKDWMWREDRVHDLLAIDDAEVLFISGCAINMGQFYSQLDHIILLAAPSAVVAERLLSRTNNDYGKSSDEFERALSLIETVEPLLRQAATAEIDTSMPLLQVLDAVLRTAGLRATNPRPNHPHA